MNLGPHCIRGPGHRNTLPDGTGPASSTRLVKIRTQLKGDGWDYDPRTIHDEATIQETFPGGVVPSVATMARLLSSVGQVDAAQRKRPKSACIPFARSTAMAMWQLDGFECRLTNEQTVTIYQVGDDATRHAVGTWAHARHDDSADAKLVLGPAIEEHGEPQEMLSDYAEENAKPGCAGLGPWFRELWDLSPA